MNKFPPNLNCSRFIKSHAIVFSCIGLFILKFASGSIFGISSDEVSSNEVEILFKKPIETFPEMQKIVIAKICESKSDLEIVESDSGAIPKKGIAKPGTAEKKSKAPIEKNSSLINPKKILATINGYDKKVKIANNCPINIWWFPKEGLPVLIRENFPIAKLKKLEIVLDEFLGLVEVDGRNQPRCSRIVLTETDDPGPDEKNHVPQQTAKDYRELIAVREGFYAVWIIPDNGSRAQKIADRIRVQSGKKTTVE